MWSDERGAEDNSLENRCDQQQKVQQAMPLSYSFLGVFLFFVLPFIFCTGGLAVLAGVLGARAARPQASQSAELPRATARSTCVFRP